MDRQEWLHLPSFTDAYEVSVSIFQNIRTQLHLSHKMKFAESESPMESLCCLITN